MQKTTPEVTSTLVSDIRGVTLHQHLSLAIALLARTAHQPHSLTCSVGCEKGALFGAKWLSARRDPAAQQLGHEGCLESSMLQTNVLETYWSYGNLLIKWRLANQMETCWSNVLKTCWSTAQTWVLLQDDATHKCPGDSQHAVQPIVMLMKGSCDQGECSNLCMIMTCVQTRYVDAHKTAWYIEALCIGTVAEDVKKQLFADVLSCSHKLSHPHTLWQLSCVL